MWNQIAGRVSNVIFCASIATKDTPPYTIVAGKTARVLKNFRNKVVGPARVRTSDVTAIVLKTRRICQTHRTN